MEQEDVKDKPEHAHPLEANNKLINYEGKSRKGKVRREGKIRVK